MSHSNLLTVHLKRSGYTKQAGKRQFALAYQVDAEPDEEELGPGEENVPPRPEETKRRKEKRDRDKEKTKERNR